MTTVSLMQRIVHIWELAVVCKLPSTTLTNTMDGGTGPSTRIDIESLKHDLNTFKKRLDTWADSIVDRTEAEKSQHVREMQKLSGSIENLQKEHYALQEQASGIRQRLQNEQIEQQGLVQELEDVRGRQAALPEIISQVQEALNTEASSLFRKKAKVESKVSIQRDLEKGLGKIIHTYSKQLGLILTPKHGGIEVGFTQIDEANTDRVFSVHVSCGNDGEYSVSSNTSPVPDFGQYLDDLNATGDFSSFVLNVRKAFVDSCRQR